MAFFQNSRNRTQIGVGGCSVVGGRVNVSVGGRVNIGAGGRVNVGAGGRVTSIDLNGVVDEDNAAPENDINNQKHTVKDIVDDFCSNSTVHRVRYFTEPNRHLLERLWWAIVVLSSVILCVFLISSIWTNWHQHPVTVTFDDKSTSISTLGWHIFKV